MILLDERREDGAPRTFAVFGVGLIGSSVIRRLEALLPLESEVVPLDWQDPGAQRAQLLQLEEKILARIGGTGPGSSGADKPRLAVLWSAGRAGFRASEADASRELESFRRVLELVRRVRRKNPRTDLTLGFTSSAGGLFEGQRAVHRDSVPAPRRPYGHLKLAQEAMLSEMGQDLACHVYRLTSIYGSVGGLRRRGLIPTLIENGLRQDVTRITGNLSTLRDYVWVEDIAAQLARDLWAPGPPDHRVSLLASTKPSSIFEILRLVERVIGQRLYISLAGEASNRADITVARASAAPGWRTTDLETTVRYIYSNTLAFGAGRADRGP